MQNFREEETGGRDRERYDDERVDLDGWIMDVEKLANVGRLRGLDGVVGKRYNFVMDALRDFQPMK